MDAQDFASSLAALLRICRTVADEALPIEGMLAHVYETIAALPNHEDVLDRVADLTALVTIIQAVGDVAAIGARLPAEPEEPQLIQVPAGTSPGPLPSNVG